MNTFVLEIWDDECSRCVFYTVREDETEQNETDRFFERYAEDPKLVVAVQELLTLITYSIGEDHGAHSAFFNRDENEVKGLPPHGKLEIQTIQYHFPEFPLRLYAIRLRSNLVVLFGGGIKDGATNQKSSLTQEWRDACKYAKRIDQALIAKEITIDEETGYISDGDQTNGIYL